MSFTEGEPHNQDLDGGEEEEEEEEEEGDDQSYTETETIETEDEDELKSNRLGYLIYKILFLNKCNVHINKQGLSSLA